MHKRINRMSNKERKQRELMNRQFLAFQHPHYFKPKD